MAIQSKNIFISNFLTSEEELKLKIDSMIIDRNNFLNQFFLNKILRHITFFDKDYIKFINPLIKQTKMINEELEKYKIAFNSVSYTDSELKDIFEKEIENAKNIWIEKETFERLKNLYPNIEKLIKEKNFQIIELKDNPKKLKISQKELSEIISWYIKIISRIYLKEKNPKNKTYINAKRKSGRIQSLFELANPEEIKEKWKRIENFLNTLKGLKSYKKMQEKGISNHLFFKLEELVNIYKKIFI